MILRTGHKLVEEVDALLESVRRFAESAEHSFSVDVWLRLQALVDEVRALLHRALRAGVIDQAEYYHLVTRVTEAESRMLESDPVEVAGLLEAILRRVRHRYEGKAKVYEYVERREVERERMEEVRRLEEASVQCYVCGATVRDYNAIKCTKLYGDWVCRKCCTECRFFPCELVRSERPYWL